MTNILIVTSSANGAASVSSRLAEAHAARLAAAYPGAAIVRRDVGADPLPHLTADTVAAIKGTPETGAELAARALSDALVAELAAADILVIASPMYNFGMSSTLKSWFDHVLRAGVTFRYTAGGPEGLMTGKKAVVIESRGGFYSAGPAAAMDSQEAHIRTMLGFIGITEVTVVRAERLASGPEAAEAAIAAAGEALKLAA
ncbi:MAG TPA: NAD(P)H-dependent oxidoreductase [Allosphingosinicella sp.]|nr:NAD(P)H-dependent oxidoreductase [Allosphingosinicella sp.]